VTNECVVTDAKLGRLVHCSVDFGGCERSFICTNLPRRVFSAVGWFGPDAAGVGRLVECQVFVPLGVQSIGCMQNCNSLDRCHTCDFIAKLCQSEIVFRSLDESCHGKEILLILVHAFRWTQAASGAAGWANVGHCPVSSSVYLFLSTAGCSKKCPAKNLRNISPND